MSGFRKAAPKQAAVKMSMFGPPGSGKTLSMLLFLEGLAARTGKRFAVVDTERGTDFYAQAVPERRCHPGAFDFDALYSRSLSEVLKAVRGLDPALYCGVAVDSITHLWEAALNAYAGPKTGKGGIPAHAWGRIKAPYKELMKFLVDSPLHAFILGRQANVFEDDDGEMRAAGVKMRAEGETQYEPHVCLRMFPQRTERRGKKTVVHLEQVICAFAEKDRSGTLQGRLIEWPSFDSVIAPLLGALGGEQGATPSDEDAAVQDAEAAASAERDKAQASHVLAERFKARFQLAEDAAALKALGAELTPAVKKQLTAPHLAEVRNAYLARDAHLQGRPAPVNHHAEDD